MEREFEGELFVWRGPAPFHFVAVPEEVCADLRGLAGLISYGWGMVPARVTIGAATWETSLCPKDGGYLVPVRTWVRVAEHLEPGDLISLRVEVAV